MPFTRPTLKSLINEAKADFKIAIDEDIKPGGVLSAMANQMASVAHSMYGMMEWVNAQRFPTICDDDNLLQWATIYGVTRNPATQAEYILEITGGSGVIPDDTEFDVDGKKIKVISRIGSTTEYTARPEELGIAGNINIPAGNNPIAVQTVGNTPGVNEVKITRQTKAGVEIESFESLRIRILETVRNKTSGGTVLDFYRWARQAPFATGSRYWVVPTYPDPGDVTIYFLIYNEGYKALFPPTDAQKTTMQEYLKPLVPAFFEPRVLGPRQIDQVITINTSPASNSNQQDFITTTLKDFWNQNVQTKGATNPNNPTGKAFTGAVSPALMEDAIEKALRNESINLTINIPNGVDEMSRIGYIADFPTITFGEITSE